jgi:hypothetical protein
LAPGRLPCGLSPDFLRKGVAPLGRSPDERDLANGFRSRRLI